MITLLLLVRATYMNGVVLHAHLVRGESHIQCNTTGEVATVDFHSTRVVSVLSVLLCVSSLVYLIQVVEELLILCRF